MPPGFQILLRASLLIQLDSDYPDQHELCRFSPSYQHRYKMHTFRIIFLNYMIKALQL